MYNMLNAEQKHHTISPSQSVIILRIIMFFVIAQNNQDNQDQEEKNIHFGERVDCSIHAVKVGTPLIQKLDCNNVQWKDQ